MRPSIGVTLGFAALVLAAGAGIVLLQNTRAVLPEDELLAAVARDPLLASPVPLVSPSFEASSSDAIESSSTSSPSQRETLTPAIPEGDAVLVVLVVAADDGEPLAGVRISIYGDGYQAMYTDGAGRIEIAVPSGVPHRFTPLVEDGLRLAPGERREVVLRFETIELRGRVVALESGAAIAGATLELEGFWSASVKTALVSDDFGMFRVTVPKCHTQLVVSAEGFAKWTCFTGEGPKEREVLVRLARAATLVVRAVDETGRPLQLARATVAALVETPIQRAALEWEGKCDPEGRFEIDDIFVGDPIEIVVEAGERRVVQTIAALEPGEHREVVLTLEPRVAVAGRVLDQDGAPLHCEVWMVEASPDSVERYFEDSEEPERFVLSDMDGRFRIRHVRLGRWWIGPGADVRSETLSSIGYISDLPPWARLVEIREGSELDDLRLVVKRDVVVKGFVLGDRAPFLTRLSARSLAGHGCVEVTLCGVNGEFVLELAPGPHEVVAHHPTLGSSAPVLVDGATSGLVFELSGAVRVRGQVLGVTGAGGTLKYSGTKNRESSALISESGAFDLAVLAPGRYRFAAILDDGRVGLAEMEIAGSSMDLEIPLAVMGEVVVHWDGKPNEGLALTWGDFLIAQRSPTMKRRAIARSPAILPAPVGIPLVLSLLGSQRRSPIVVPESGRLEVDFRGR